MIILKEGNHQWTVISGSTPIRFNYVSISSVIKTETYFSVYN